MKNLVGIFVMILFLTVSGNVSAQCPGNPVTCKTPKSDCQGKPASVAKSELTVYYFHNERRCATCVAVEEETVKALKKLYPDQMHAGKFSFVSVNIEDSANDQLVKKLEISGQTLILMKGDKKIDLTNDAFMYARSKPEKLEKKIREAIAEVG
jgi:hypothetical protein